MAAVLVRARVLGRKTRPYLFTWPCMRTSAGWAATSVFPFRRWILEMSYVSLAEEDFKVGLD